MFVHMEMAPRENMLHLPNHIIPRRILVKMKESLKYEGISCTIGDNIESAQTHNVWGVETQSEHTGLVVKRVLWIL